MCFFTEFEYYKLNVDLILFLQMPKQFRKLQGFPEMPDFRNSLRHIHLHSQH